MEGFIGLCFMYLMLTGMLGSESLWAPVRFVIGFIGSIVMIIRIS